MRKRWYDLSPDVCIIISKIELLQEVDRIRYAKLLLTELKKNGYIPNRQLYLDRIRSYEMRRWYDKNKYLFLAFEYLKDADSGIQNNIVVSLLKYMRQENAA